jgi:pimeloyl-ACP methyl ester carboxylesterase
MKKLIYGLVAALALSGVFNISPVTADSPDVILIHGWRGTASSWSTAESTYVANGYRTHALQLPRDGSRAGDTVTNANYVRSYIVNNGLTNVKLDGHSMGGWVALYLILVEREPAVTSVVLRDTGTGCFWGIPPDQCSGSAMLQAVQSAAPVNIPVLNLSTKTTQHPEVDCTKVFNISHNNFLTNATVNSMAVSWSGVNPCTTVTPVPDPTQTPTCSWWQRLFGGC